MNGRRERKYIEFINDGRNMYVVFLPTQSKIAVLSCSKMATISQNMRLMESIGEAYETYARQLLRNE